MIKGLQYKENFAQMKNDKRIIEQTFYQKRKISTEFTHALLELKSEKIMQFWKDFKKCTLQKYNF